MKLLLAFVLSIFAASAHAQSYVRIDAGGAYLAPTAFSTPFGNSTLKAKTGEAISGAVGYRFSPQLAAEIEAGYIHASLSTVDGVLNGVAVGNVDAFTGMGNALYYPLVGYFQPYLGGGIGAANLHASISSLAGLSASLTENKTALAWQGIAGFDYKLSTALSIGARYRYLHIDSQQDFYLLGTSVHQDNAAAHLFSATLTYRF